MTGRKGLCGAFQGRIGLTKAGPVPLSTWCMHNLGNGEPVGGKALSEFTPECRWLLGFLSYVTKTSDNSKLYVTVDQIHRFQLELETDFLAKRSQTADLFFPLG